MKAITKAIVGCALVPLLGFAFASQPAQTATSSPQIRRRINVRGVRKHKRERPFSADLE